MTAPWYVYLIGLLVALPVYVLIAVGAVGLVKALIAWLTMPEGPKKA